MEYTPEETELVAVWRELLEQHARLTGALERRLQEEHGLGVSEYEVLERLAGADKPERRMQELADAVHLSQSALSRVVARACATTVARTRSGLRRFSIPIAPRQIFRLRAEEIRKP